MTEIRQADPRTRRLAMWLMAAALVIALLIVTLLPSMLEAWLTQDGADAGERSVLLLRGLAVFLMVALCLPATYLFVIANRVAAAGEYPPPGMALVKPAKVLRGKQAISRARVLWGLGILLIMMAAVNTFLILNLSNSMRF